MASHKGITGNPGKKQSGVMFANQDAGREKKFEGYSNLKGDADKKDARAKKEAGSNEMQELEDKYRLNL